VILAPATLVQAKSLTALRKLPPPFYFFCSPPKNPMGYPWIQSNFTPATSPLLSVFCSFHIRLGPCKQPMAAHPAGMPVAFRCYKSLDQHPHHGQPLDCDATPVFWEPGEHFL
jgi:hypothetical protein